MKKIAFLLVALGLSALLTACPTGGVVTPPPPPPKAGFQIDFLFETDVPADIRPVFEQAAQRWQEVIVGDLPNYTGNLQPSDCGKAIFTPVTAVDDVVMYVAVRNIDGAGGTLAFAGPCHTRKNNGLTIDGDMTVDLGDVPGMKQNDELYETILHEMGHVLGFGTLFENKNLIVGQGTTTCGTNPQYTGAAGKLEWVALGGSGNVPLEKNGGPGTCESHWPEATMSKELMSGYSNPGPEPLGRISVAVFQDLGYEVNLAKADVYSLSHTFIGPLAVNAQHKDKTHGPIGVLP